MITIPRQQCSILAGASGAGKTTLVMQVLADWCNDKTFTPALKFDATKIAYLVADRTCEEVRIRKKRLHIPDEKMQVYGIQDDLSFDLKNLKEGELALRTALHKFSNDYDMLVIDPIALFISGDTNNFREVAISLMKIGRIAIEKNITIFAVHHASKSRSDFTFKRPQDRINGSGAFQGFSGTQMVLIEGKEDDKAYDSLFVIPHMGPMQTTLLVRDEVGDFAVLEQNNTDIVQRGKLEIMFDKIPYGEPFHITTIHRLAEDQGVSRSAAFKLVKEMLEDKTMKKVGRGEYCRVAIKED